MADNSPNCELAASTNQMDDLADIVSTPLPVAQFNQPPVAQFDAMSIEGVAQVDTDIQMASVDEQTTVTEETSKHKNVMDTHGDILEELQKSHGDNTLADAAEGSAPTRNKKGPKLSRTRTVDASVTSLSDEVQLAESDKEAYRALGMRPPVKSAKVGEDRDRMHDNEKMNVRALDNHHHQIAQLGARIDEMVTTTANSVADIKAMVEGLEAKLPAGGDGAADNAGANVSPAEFGKLQKLLLHLVKESTETRERVASVTTFLNDIAGTPEALKKIQNTMASMQASIHSLQAGQTNAPRVIAPLPQAALRAPRPDATTAHNQIKLPEAKFTFGKDAFVDESPFILPERDPTFIEINDDDDFVDVAHSTGKRRREPSPAPPPSGSSQDFQTYCDIYLWDVHVEQKSPTNNARALGERAVKKCGVDPSTVKSSRMLRGYDKVLSIRFESESAAREFHATMKTNPPEDMKNLHVATPVAFGKRAENAKKSSARQNPNGCRTLLAWNIDGRLALKLTDPDFVEIIQEADIVFVQETFMRGDEERTLDLPRGFEVVARARPDVPGSHGIWGGVAVLIRRGINYRVVEHLSAPDLIVLDLGDMYFVGSYVLPAGSNWQRWTDVDPETRLGEALTFCAASPSKPLLAMGDINARIANLSPTNSPFKRLSSDDKDPDTRGRRFVSTCSALNLVILNGTIKEASIPGAFTSFQPRGATVIDYAVCSPALLERLQTGALVIARHRRWSDHASLSIEIAADPVPQLPRFPRAPPMEFPGETALDRLAADAVRAGVDVESHSTRLYGLVYDRGSPVSTYIAAAAQGPHSAARTATAAAYWGTQPISARPDRQPRNTAARIPGRQDIDRAGHWAVYLAVTTAPKTRPLLIYTSNYALISMYCSLAPTQAVEGWSMPNSDVVELVARHIQARTAPVEFRLADPHSNAHLAASLAMAENALHPSLCDVVLDFDEYPPWPNRCDMAEEDNCLPIATAKVFCNSPPSKKGKVYAVKLALADVVDMDDNHRGRKRERELLLENLKLLLGCRTNREFWDLIRRWTDPRRIPPAVSPSNEHASYRRRLNPPEILPDYFDPKHYDLVMSLASMIPIHTKDRTLEGYFSRPAVIAEIQTAKARLLEKPPNSAFGIDEVSYGQIRSIPDEALVELFNTCLRELDTPRRWLVTVLVGILKPGKCPFDPESYRAVGLECCLLRVMTMIFDGRVETWAEDNNVLPDSQSGFRKGRRTEDGAFILAAAISRARAEGKTLFVLFGDMTNAFPYTDMPTLWTDLYRRGVGGPWFDFMRMIYARMRYSTRNCADEPFASGVGLMTGDSASPGLWNLFFADYQVRPHAGDVKLHGRVVNQVELADDNGLLCCITDGLQMHADDWRDWARRKRAYISVPKTDGMIFGMPPNPLPVIRIGDAEVKWVTEKKFQGIWFASNTTNIFEPNYTKSAAKARNAMNAIFALRHRIGSMPVKVGLQLYMSRVDPYLTRAADISIDIDGNVKELEAVQHEFLRRLLGLGPRSVNATLFTETGIQPIRTRRLDLALGRARYTAGINDERILRCAMRDGLDLWLQATPKPSWASNIANALCAQKPSPILIYPSDFLVPAKIDAVRDTLQRSSDAALQAVIDTSVKCRLLRDRLELGSGSLEQVPRRRRHYLTMILNPAHRKSLTRLYTSNHALSIEIQRYGDRNHREIPREKRLCRFCQLEVEDEPHALLRCNGNEGLVDLRMAFMRDVLGLDSSLRDCYHTGDAIRFLQLALASRRAVGRLARFAHEVLAVYATAPLYWAEGYEAR